MYFDLNVIYPTGSNQIQVDQQLKELEDTLKMLIHFDYYGMCLNHVVDKIPPNTPNVMIIILSIFTL